MNLLDRLIAWRDPERALARVRARAALAIVANYDAATRTSRGSSWARARGTDADAAAWSRARLRNVTRDMIRNVPFAARGQAVIVSNVVGDGIIPKVSARSSVLRRDLMQLVQRHLDTTAIDADGQQNLYGLQALALAGAIDAGEVFLRRRRRRASDGLALPFQIQILEADFLDTSREGAAANGGYIREGIEFDAIGRRVAYWLYDEHPGAEILRPRSLTSRRVDAAEVIHLYRQDRPGQRRGVSWFAPVALNLQDLADGVDAHLVRQKIAACFAAFEVDMDGETGGLARSEDERAQESLEKIRPGRIERLRPGRDIRFAAPPPVEGFDEFTRVILRSVAAGLGITYEALTGDLSGVNFSSARMGRMEMNRNVSRWQNLMLVPQMCDRIAAWFLEAAALQMGRTMPADVRLEWTPPTPMMVDPQRELGALRDKVRAGFASRQQAIRELGYDPEAVLAEQIEDAAAADAAELVFDSDARVARAGQAAPQGTRDESATSDAEAIAAAVRAIPAPVVNVAPAAVHVAAPEIRVEAPSVKAGDVHVDVHMPRRGPVERTVTGYDERGRIVGMTEKEIDE